MPKAHAKSGKLEAFELLLQITQHGKKIILVYANFKASRMLGVFAVCHHQLLANSSSFSKVAHNPLI